MLIRIMSAQPQAVLLAVVPSVLSVTGTDFTMRVRENIDKLPVGKQQIEEILKRRQR